MAVIRNWLKHLIFTRRRSCCQSTNAFYGLPLCHSCFFKSTLELVGFQSVYINHTNCRFLKCVLFRWPDFIFLVNKPFYSSVVSDWAFEQKQGFSYLTSLVTFQIYIILLSCLLVSNLSQHKVNPNLSFIQRLGYISQNLKMVFWFVCLLICVC